LFLFFIFAKHSEMIAKLTILAVASAITADNVSYTQTPAGFVLAHCVHTIPSDSHVRELDSGDSLVTPPDAAPYIIPKCDDLNGTFPVLTSTPPGSGSGSDPNPLPPDYDGWLQYTAFKDDVGFDQFLGVMSVPDLPKAKPQILYLFPGVQNIDWIPKVDPEPTRSNPFDILQPVLQFPASGFRGGWSVKSWYVTVNAGALQSSELSVEAGDAILCNMTRTGPDSWFVGSTIKSTGKSTNQFAQNDRLKSQPWAYNTLECYGCRSCSTYPTEPIVFSDLKLYSKGTQVTPTWLIDPKPQPSQKCKEATKVGGPDSVTISFQ
jgi:hypothetical protein